MREHPSIEDLGAAVRLRDELQKVRIACGNRVEAIKAERSVGVLSFWEGQRDLLLAREGDIEGLVRNIVSDHLVWTNWAQDVKGVGPITLGLILGEIDINRAHSISALWRYSGYAVINGQRQRPTKGQKLDYNRRLKTYVFRQMSSLMRAGGAYSELYYRFREEEEAKVAKNPDPNERADTTEESIVEERAIENEQPDGSEPSIPKNKMHVHLRAIRRMAKVWLSHLWVVWRTAEGLPVSQPWIIEHGGHTDYIAPMKG